VLSFLKEHELRPFVEWLKKQPHKHKIVIAGNHDRMLDTHFFADRMDGVDVVGAKRLLSSACTYLEDDSVEIAGYTFYGSPWTPAALGWSVLIPLALVFPSNLSFPQISFSLPSANSLF
jgi:hypothetical protein